MQSDKARKINVHLVGWEGVGRVSAKACLKDVLPPEETVEGGRNAAKAARAKAQKEDKEISGITSNKIRMENRGRGERNRKIRRGQARENLLSCAGQGATEPFRGTKGRQVSERVCACAHAPT